MNSNLSFVVKLLLVSTILSYAIKYGGPFLRIPATPFNVMLAIVSPTLLLSALLGWRAQQQK